MTTLAQFGLVQRTYDRQIGMLANEQRIAREVTYFRETIGVVTSGDELIDDYRLYSFAMKAFGLGSELYAKGLMRKVFEEGVIDKQAMANQLVDAKYREIATAFGFAETGAARMNVTANVEDVVDRYLRQELEEREGEANEAVRLALYFERKAPQIQSWYDVLGDKALAEVARTALGLPPEFALTNIDRQAAYFEERLKLEDFKDPEKLTKFIQRFAAQWDLQNGGPLGANALAGSGIAPIAPLGPGGAQIVTIDPALLAELGRYRV